MTWPRSRAPRSSPRRPTPRRSTSRGSTFPSGVALTARNYMQTYGVTEEDLAHTSVKNHHYGARNPYAHLRFECTVEEVMRSAKVADPLKLYEVCPMTDASSALVLCREEILRDQPDKPQVYVTATQMATGTWYAANDTLDDAHALFAAPSERAYAMAGIAAGDVDVAEIYNSFAVQEPIGIEGPRVRPQGRGVEGRRRRLDLDRRRGGGQPLPGGSCARATRSGPPARPRPWTSSSSCAAPPRPTCSARTPRSAYRPAAGVRARSARSTSTSAPRGLAVTVSAIEFSRLGPPKLRLYAMSLQIVGCGELAYFDGGGNITGDPSAPQKWQKVLDYRRTIDLEHWRTRVQQRLKMDFVFASTVGQLGLNRTQRNARWRCRL